MISPLALFWQTRYGKPIGSRAEIEARQAIGFRYLRQKVMAKSPFYAAFAEQPISLWPQMNKSRLMEHFGAINTCGISREAALDLALRSEQSRDFSPMLGQVAIGLSTGTSGQRGLFASNRRERALWAALMVGRFMPKLYARQSVAFFLRANNALYENLSNPLITFNFYDLLDGVEAHFARLARQDPSVLIGPSQILGLLAEAQEARQIQLNPKVIIAVAEVLSPEDALKIERAFGRRVDQVYQCTEGVLGMTCRCGSLHLNEDFLHIARDVVDPETGAFCPVITDLARETLPILNYRLDDVLVPDPTPCGCGSARLRLSRIDGRADDLLYWPTKAGGRRLVASDVIRQAVALSSAKVVDYRAVQYGQSRLDIALQSGEFAQAVLEISAYLQEHADKIGCTLPKLTFQQGFVIDPSQKRRRVTARREDQASVSR